MWARLVLESGARKRDDVQGARQEECAGERESSETWERQPAQRGSWGLLCCTSQRIGHDNGHCEGEGWDRLERVAVCERCTVLDGPRTEGMMGSALAARASGIGQAEGSDRIERAAPRSFHGALLRGGNGDFCF